METQTLREWLAVHTVEIATACIGVHTDPAHGKDGRAWEHYLWNVRLTYQGRAFETPYKCGLGNSKEVRSSPGRMGTKRVPVAPTVHDVLLSLQSDARSGEHMLFEDFASEFGYDTDSREAERIWRACQETRGRLQKLLGADFETFMSATEE